MADPVAPVLPARELHRALLDRQLLLQRADVPLERAVQRMGFVQAQYAPSMYIGLWSRVAGFERAHLTAALRERRVVQGTLLRSTIHLVAAGDWWPAALAVRAHRRKWWLRAHGGGPDLEREVASAADRTRALLAGGPRRRAELVAALGVDSALWNGIGLWLDLVRVPPSGTWERRSADLYALADQWLGPPPGELDEADGLELLLRRYLGAFGPAPLGDAANWAGVPVAAMAGTAARLDLSRFAGEDGRELLDLPGVPLPPGDRRVPVRFLPTWDAVLLAHARRAGVLAEEHRPLLFSTKSPQSTPSFLVDGRVAGTWRFDEGRIAVRPFAALPARVQRSVDAEAARLLDLHR
ncbi:MAG TPA: winged helix DNA-binding domain-containing protein [Acidimicrobiales bacterium]|nr:winged helix DNA-binding domain-containing protein [Acidimicrobiales bacterium]